MEYRKAVSGILFQNSEFALTNSRGWDPDTLCFPQGGIKEGETEQEALRRELKEELKISTFEIVEKSSHVHSYEFDDRERDGYSRQRQTIWYVRFTSEKSDINVPNDELQKVEWVKRENVLESLSFEEQKETYEKALKQWDEKIRAGKIGENPGQEIA